MFWWQWDLKLREALETNIEALERGDYWRVVTVFRVLAGRNKKLKRRAAKALWQVLPLLSFEDILLVDRDMRERDGMLEWVDWSKYEMADFLTPEMTREEHNAVVVFASFNPNGFIREQAVALMRDYDHMLPYLSLRLNDWVIEVRQAAAKVFAEKMETLKAGDLLAVLPYVEKLKRGGRAAHGAVVGAFFEKLMSEEYRDELRLGLESSNVRIRRICINGLFETSYSNERLALEHLLLEPDAFLRSFLFRRLCDANVQMDEEARVLLRDRLALNRLLALQYFYRMDSDAVDDIAVEMLMDKKQRVRELARVILRRRKRAFDFAAFYRGKLDDAGVAAIAGLGETGRREDAGYLVHYLKDSRSSYVCAALVALMALDGDTYQDCAFDLLDDGRRSVVKTAQKMMIKYEIMDYELVQKIFWSTAYDHTKVVCAAMLYTAPKWSRLIYILDTLSDDGEMVRQLAQQALGEWLFCYNQWMAPLGETQKKTILGLISGLDERLSAGLKKQLLFVVR